MRLQIQGFDAFARSVHRVGAFVQRDSKTLLLGGEFLQLVGQRSNAAGELRGLLFGLDGFEPRAVEAIGEVAVLVFQPAQVVLQTAPTFGLGGEFGAAARKFLRALFGSTTQFRQTILCIGDDLLCGGVRRFR